jgi:cell division protein FtsA
LALASEAPANEVITIPGLKGREPKEISVKNLAKIIEARLEEILELVYFEVKSSGLEKKLAGGIVLTGGGSMLKHIIHLASRVTGLDARVGYPNEHLAKGMIEEANSPIYATGIGLVMKGLADAMLNDNLIKSASADVIDEATKKSTVFKKGFNIFNMNIIKKWLTDDKEFNDFD